MNKLLSANFIRLIKNKTFWLGMIFMFCIGIYATINHYKEMVEYDMEVALDELFFLYALIICIPLSVFCSLFIGREYSDGTIRNKLVIGHTRRTIYLSNLIICSVASVLMCISAILGVCLPGIQFFGFFHTDGKAVLVLILISLMMLLALSAILSFLGMLIQNRAISAVISILGVYTLLFLAVYLKGRLSEPPMYDSYVVTDSTGQLKAAESEPNPYYLEGTKREVYQFLLDFLPTGQGMQIASMEAVNLYMPIYSGIILIAFTIGGIFIFRRKDIK